MAAALLAAHLLERGSEGDVTSAGLGPSGEPATPDTVAVMADIGIDLSAHLSRRVSPADLAGADLILGMTREHVIALAVLDPDSWPRIFPLVDMLRRAHQIGPRGQGESPEEWILRAHGGRQRSSVLSLKSSDEIADPIGQSLAAFRRTRDKLDGLLSDLATLLEPSRNGLPG
jgi:protein-tyrosine phosphatase